MKRMMILLGCMSLGLAHAQQQGRAHAQHNGAQKRVGINTTKPVATMEIRKADGIPATQVQGFLLPHLSQTERNAMEKEALTNGVMIFNTTKNCIDWWDGAHWQCTDGSYQDEHGDDFNPVKSFTGTYTHPVTTQNFTKNDCVAPQTGTTVSYTSQAITKTYVSNISQKDANEQAEQQALAEFNRLGQQYANQNGVCRNPIGVEASGFDGAFTVGSSLSTSPYHYVKFKVRNDGSTPISNIDLSRAVTVTGGGVTILSSQNTRVSVAQGEEKEIIYRLTGTLTEGTITANFNHSILGTATQQKDVKDTRGYCYKCVQTNKEITEYDFKRTDNRMSLEQCKIWDPGMSGPGHLWINAEKTEKVVIDERTGPAWCVR